MTCLTLNVTSANIDEDKLLAALSGKSKRALFYKKAPVKMSIAVSCRLFEQR